MHIVLVVDVIHSPRVEEDEQDENIDRSLLGKPETQLKPADAYGVELFDEQDAKDVRGDEPHAEANSDEPQIGTPISKAIFFMHEPHRCRTAA